jgi:hypothetical protein
MAGPEHGTPFYKTKTNLRLSPGLCYLQSVGVFVVYSTAAIIEWLAGDANRFGCSTDRFPTAHQNEKS